ncbi:hypothetical protein Tco_0004038 [Tanacetum coccineum]
MNFTGDLGIGEEVVTCKLYLGLAFTIPTLERVTIGCCEVGGGGGVVGGVGVVCGDGVDRGVGGVDCGVVKAPESKMIVSVPEKDRWCGARGKDVIVDGGGGEDIKIVCLQVDKSLDLSISNIPAYSSGSCLQGLLVVGDRMRFSESITTTH